MKFDVHDKMMNFLVLLIVLIVIFSSTSAFASIPTSEEPKADETLIVEEPKAETEDPFKDATTYPPSIGEQDLKKGSYTTDDGKKIKIEQDCKVYKTEEGFVIDGVAVSGDNIIYDGTKFELSGKGSINGVAVSGDKVSYSKDGGYQITGSGSLKDVPISNAKDIKIFPDGMMKGVSDLLCSVNGIKFSKSGVLFTYDPNKKKISPSCGKDECNIEIDDKNLGNDKITIDSEKPYNIQSKDGASVNVKGSVIVDKDGSIVAKEMNEITINGLRIIPRKDLKIELRLDETVDQEKIDKLAFEKEPSTEYISEDTIVVFKDSMIVRSSVFTEMFFREDKNRILILDNGIIQFPKEYSPSGKKIIYNIDTDSDGKEISATFGNNGEFTLKKSGTKICGDNLCVQDLVNHILSKKTKDQLSEIEKLNKAAGTNFESIDDIVKLKRDTSLSTVFGKNDVSSEKNDVNFINGNIRYSYYLLYTNDGTEAMMKSRGNIPKDFTLEKKDFNIEGKGNIKSSGILINTKITIEDGPFYTSDSKKRTKFTDTGIGKLDEKNINKILKDMEFDPELTKIISEYGSPEDQRELGIIALNEGKGKLDPGTSSQGAKGPFQFIPKTAKDICKNEEYGQSIRDKWGDCNKLNIKDPVLSRDLAVAYLDYLRDKKCPDSDIFCLCAGYHGGESACDYVINDNIKGLKKNRPKSYSYAKDCKKTELKLAQGSSTATLG